MPSAGLNRSIMLAPVIILVTRRMHYSRNLSWYTVLQCVLHCSSLHKTPLVTVSDFWNCNTRQDGTTVCDFRLFTPFTFFTHFQASYTKYSLWCYREWNWHVVLIKCTCITITISNLLRTTMSSSRKVSSKLITLLIKKVINFSKKDRPFAKTFLSTLLCSLPF